MSGAAATRARLKFPGSCGHDLPDGAVAGMALAHGPAAAVRGDGSVPGKVPRSDGGRAGNAWQAGSVLFMAERSVSAAERRSAGLVVRAEDRYRSFFENDLTGDFVATPGGRVVLCNEAFAEIFGFAGTAEAHGALLSRLQPGPGAWRDLVRLVRARRTVRRHESEWVRLDGSRVYIVQTLIGTFDGRGRLVEIQGFLFDDTECRHAAMELERYQNELQRLVRERTEQLQSSYEQLRLADRLASIGTLAAGLGHDMSNVLLPVRARLNAMRAAVGSVGNRGGQPMNALELREHIGAIAHSVAYLQSLADGLHYMAQDPDNSQPDGPPTDLRRWWRQAGTVITKVVPKHVRITASFPRTLPAVTVAPHRLTQAVLNLVVNAGEAIPPPDERGAVSGRRGRIRVWAEPFDDEDGGRGPTQVRLMVSDNGRGMTPEVKRRAFELFFTTKPRGLGSGLGLPLVHRVASRVGGTVEIDTTVGKGTTVSMTLPASRPKSSAAGTGFDEATAAAVVRAVVTCGEAGTAGVACNLLEAASCTVSVDDRPDGASVWVVEPGPGVLEMARRWAREERRHLPFGRALVLLGRPKGASLRVWRRLRWVTIVDDSCEFETLRSAIARAVRRARTADRTRA